ncbi:QRFP-like peptide receptor [Aplysia californica]|uniref:QRFP-like peptide receptor n=1 Tax=Aplysia californica TaxID=6500 RepID=A0ABM0JC51_APLCA|nr:QRFP-like peptide receptor [Aplysia californica]
MENIMRSTLSNGSSSLNPDVDMDRRTFLNSGGNSTIFITTTINNDSSSAFSTGLPTSTDMSSLNSSNNINMTMLPPVEMIPYASQIILVMLYTLTTAAALIGNSLAIVVFTKGKRSNTELRPFLLNLAVADLIMAIFCIPFTFAYQITGHWIFSDIMCPIVQCCQVVSVLASVSTNTAIGIDRLVAVKFPLRKRVTSSRSKLVILCIWAFALSLGVIALITGRTKEVGGRVLCEEVWPDQDSKLAYGFFIMIITYFLPVTILSVTYIGIGRQLWRRNLPGNADDNRDAQQLKSKRKVVKMLATIVLLFGLCWLPLHLFMMVVTFKYNAFGDAANEIYFGVHWLSMANSFVNPVVYGFMNDNFRADLRSLQQSCHCWPWSRHRKAKYRTAAMRWRLGDHNVHDATANFYATRTLNRHHVHSKPTAETDTRHSMWRNGHAHSRSAPTFDTSGLSKNDYDGESHLPLKASAQARRQNGDTKKDNSTGDDVRGGRNIFISGKRRHYQPCVHRDSRPGSSEENGFLLVGNSNNRNDIVRSSGKSGCGHSGVFYDGSDHVVLKDSYRKINGV